MTNTQSTSQTAATHQIVDPNGVVVDTARSFDEACDEARWLELTTKQPHTVRS